MGRDSGLEWKQDHSQDGLESEWPCRAVQNQSWKNACLSVEGI